METPLTEISELQSDNSSSVIDHNHDNLVSSLSNHGGIASKDEFAEEEVRNILEVIAATGKFWHDWDKLKSMLSFYLKQILSEYPEAKMTSDQQTTSLGETYPELVKRLDDALHSFIEGPPFTLQRLSEILLAARSIYSNLSKLALALEKWYRPDADISAYDCMAYASNLLKYNLYVTSMLIICADPYPSAMAQIMNEQERETEELQLQSNPEQNGVEPMVVDRDEVVMAELKADIENEMMLDMSAFEDLVGRPVDPVPRQTGEL